MLICAYRKGHGPAAHKLGVRAKLHKNLALALEYYQAATRFGNKNSSVALRIIFGLEHWSSRDKQDQATLREFEIAPDPERERRYDQISDALDLNPDLKLTRLDQVLPLPPAELPAWKGIQDAIEPEPDGPPSY
ncbi:DUF6396 domain-containing protein [Massilia jejuensis]|uniref:DUF6396 domain-containing protein n=1 Tax=Massilia jejuensis TaxID=648894 RepID=A0ABW0PDM6_9BURK